jgi:hypothetical protein
MCSIPACRRGIAPMPLSGSADCCLDFSHAEQRIPAYIQKMAGFLAKTDLIVV